LYSNSSCFFCGIILYISLSFSIYYVVSYCCWGFKFC
jgi:hypothetical protein